MAIEVKSPELIITSEKPKLLTYKNIIYWSATLKELQGIKEGSAIRTKALIFLKADLIFYDFNTKVFIVRALKGYNKTDYTIQSENGHFTCTCQFYNKVSKHWDHPRCSHITAVLLWLEMNRWNTKGDRQ